MLVCQWNLQTKFIMNLHQIKICNKPNQQFSKSNLKSKATKKDIFFVAFYFHDLNSMLVLCKSCTDMYLFLQYETYHNQLLIIHFRSQTFNVFKNFCDARKLLKSIKISPLFENKQCCNFTPLTQPFFRLLCTIGPTFIVYETIYQKSCNNDIKYYFDI